MKKQVPTGVVVLVIVAVLLVIAFVGYRYIWAPPRRGNPQVLGPEFFQPATPAQPAPQGTGVGEAYGGARVVRPGSGN